VLKNNIVGRLLHACFAVAIVCQLMSSKIMHHAAFARFLDLTQGQGFLLHKTIGLFALGFVLLYWLWVLTLRRDKLHHLFAWLTRKGRAKVAADSLSILRGRLPEDSEGGLAGLVHGLGLLLVTFVGLCGLILFFFLPLHQAWVHDVKETHGDFASWIWWYVAGHTMMAIWHSFAKRRSSS